MIEVRVFKAGRPIAVGEADSPEQAVYAARTMARDDMVACHGRGKAYTAAFYDESGELIRGGVRYSDLG